MVVFRSCCCVGFLHLLYHVFFFFKQKTAYEVRISDWSSDVCSSDLQAPLSFSALPGIGVGLDMERVEVLKGPQGILFGQNSTGGAINYIANKPTDTLTSGFSLGYGRFSTVEGEAFISGPVTDTLNIRLAGRSTYAGSWQKNYFSRPGDEFGKRREFAGRITLDWKPTDRLSFMASLSGWHDGSEPQRGQYILDRQSVA